MRNEHLEGSASFRFSSDIRRENFDSTLGTSNRFLKTLLFNNNMICTQLLILQRVILDVPEHIPKTVFLTICVINALDS